MKSCLRWRIGPAELSIGQYYRQLSDAVDAKAGAGYETTITDFWGRALSYQLYNASDGGPGVNRSQFRKNSRD